MRRLAAALTLVAAGLPAGALANVRAGSLGFEHVRLEGQFTMAGRVTVAHGIPGERVGQAVARMWNFLAPCPAGQCRVETLVRARAGGTDSITLRRRPGGLSQWVGTGSFYAPLRCGSRVYRRGERVSFTISVQITGETIVNGTPLATSVRAGYRSDRRTNRTRCVAALGRDAAAYTGTPTTPVQPVPTPGPG